MDAPVIHMNSGTSSKALKAEIPTAIFDSHDKSDLSTTKRIIREGDTFIDNPFFKKK